MNPSTLIENELRKAQSKGSQSNVLGFTLDAMGFLNGGSCLWSRKDGLRENISNNGMMRFLIPQNRVRSLRVFSIHLFPINDRLRTYFFGGK